MKHEFDPAKKPITYWFKLVAATALNSTGCALIFLAIPLLLTAGLCSLGAGKLDK